MNTCATCQYFSQSSCHRYPPVSVGCVESNYDRDREKEFVETYTRSKFPSVTADDWCGEHKSKP